MGEGRSRLRESIREMVVVVVSILIAFGLDAAWDERQERQEERRILESIATDMRWNVEELDRALTLHRIIQDASLELVEHMGPDPAGIPLERFDSLLFESVAYWTYDPRVGSIESVLNRLDLVSDLELRTTLTRWPETLRDYREDEERAAHEVDDQLLPRLQAEVPMGFYPPDVVLGEWHLWGERSAGWLTERGVRQVLGDLFIANELMARAYRQSTIIDEGADLRELMTTIIALIEADLGR